MRYSYYFCYDTNPWLEDFLKTNGIKHTLETIGDRNLVIFKFYSTTPNANAYLEELKKKWITPLVDTEYSEKDLNSAKLLDIRPYKYFFDIVNEDEAFQYSCLCRTVVGGTTYVHEKQVANIAVKKEPALNTRTAFWCTSTGGPEVFVDKRIHQLAVENDLCGLRFDHVFVRKKVSENIFQLTTDHIIDKAKIGTGYGERIFKCPACGKEEYLIERGLYVLHLDYSKIEMDSDLYMTEGIRSWGCHLPRYLISQRFYQLLKANKLTGNIDFTPVESV